VADISAVPGTGRIMEILVQLVADPGALGAAGATWTAAATAATSMGDVVAAKASALDGAWDGDGADAVVGYANQLRTALDAVEPVAKTVSDALVHAEQALTAAHSAVEAITDRVHTAVVALPTQRGDPAGALNHETAVAEIVGPAVREAENALNTAVSALRDATGQITAACGSTPVHSLPPTSAQPFEPAQFTATAWQAHSASDADIASQGAGAAPTHEFASTAGGAGSNGGVGMGSSRGGGAGIATGDGGSGGGGGDLGGGPPAGGGRAAPAQVQQWIDQAIEILRAQGVPVDKMSRADIWTIIEHESGSDPHAINNWDSNAAKGTPSKGLMQCIGPTFTSNALPGHGDIWNPVDNIIAGVRYSISRYGSVSNVPGVAGMRGGSGYVGY